MTIRVRPLDSSSETEVNFVRKSMLRGIRRARHIPRAMSDEKFFGTFAPIVDDIMHTADVSVAETGVDGEISGFSACEDNLLIWVYTKQVYRRMGVAAQLLSECHAPHMAFESWRMPESLFGRFTYCPYLIGR